MVMSFWRFLERAARARPDEVVLADDYARTLTLTTFRAEAERAAAGLVERGVRPGDVVSWQLPTTLEAAVLLAACTRLGVVQNPVIPVWREREVGFIVRQLEPSLLVVPETWRGFTHGDMARGFGVEVLALDLAQPPGFGLRLPGGDPANLPYPPDSTAECRWVYYTSGTTSEPKGARHTDASVMASARGMVEQVGISAPDVYPIAWPFAHIGGIAMLAAVIGAGGQLVLFDGFDPAVTPLRMAAHHPTLLGSATPFFQAYIDSQRHHGNEPLFPELRGCVAGGAPTPQVVNRDVAEVLGVAGVVGAWGLTEFPIATTEAPDDVDLGTTVGRPVAGVKVRVVDGELRLKGPQCMLGYVDQTLDGDAFDEDGWFRTGDIGAIGPDGRVRVMGRLKDVIIRNAENISALEVEEALLRHPAVADAAVVGVPDSRTGERVCVFVVASPGTTVTLDDLAEHCRRLGLARHKRPEQLHILESLPRNSMGKVLKNELRQESVRPTG
jgi:acyl-CoA synthetase (AMP-forming)/AMP-acid ligase II